MKIKLSIPLRGVIVVDVDSDSIVGPDRVQELEITYQNEPATLSITAVEQKGFNKKSWAICILKSKKERLTGMVKQFGKEKN